MPALATVINMVEVAVLLVALGSGMAAAIMIGITTRQFAGQCILKAGATLVTPTVFTIESSSYSRCQFCLVIHVVGILLALVLLVYRIQVICRGKCDVQQMGRFVFSIVFGLMSFLLLVEACLVTVGLKTFCNNLLALEGTWPDSCEGFQRINWDDSFNGDHFYGNLTTAEAASWISLLVWLALTGISMANVCIHGRCRTARKAKHGEPAAISQPEL